MAGIDLGAFLKSVTSTKGTINDAISAITGSAAPVDASYAESVRSGTSVANNAALVMKTKQDANLAAELSLENFSLRGETDTGDVAGTQARLAERYATQRENLAGMNQQIQAKLGADPFENPLDWLTAKLTVDRDIAVYNAAEQESNATQQTLIGMNQMVDARHSALEKLKRTTTAASALAATEVVREQAMIQVQGMQREQLLAGTNRAKEIAGMSVQRMHADSAALSAVQQAEQLDMARERMKMERAAHQERLTKAQDDNDALAYVIDRIKLGADIASRGNPNAMDGLSAKDVRLFAQGKIKDPKIQQYYNVGADNWGLGKPGTTRVLGISPSETLERVSILRPAFTPAVQAAYDRIIVAGAVQATRTDAYKKAAMDLKPGQPASPEMRKIIDDVIKAKVKADFENPEAPGSIAYLPPIMGLFDVLPQLKQTELFKNVLGPAEAAGKTFPDAASVIAYVRESGRAGKISVNAAMRDISTVYRKAQEFSIESKQLRQMGLMGKDTPVSYKINPGRSFGRFFASPVDLADPIAVGELLMASPVGNASNGFTLSGVTDDGR